MPVLERSELLSREEAAKFLGLTVGTLNVWSSTKRYNLRFIKVGRLAKYRLSDLEAWLASREQSQLTSK
jgi:excisionase family DNA binding protein